LAAPALPWQQAALELPSRTALSERTRLLNDVAIAYPTKEMAKADQLLAERGVTLYGRVCSGVTHSIHLTDPDGNKTELDHELPRALEKLY
jgi:catechol-2,3-dioxygenase